jgi:hypothetical protein
MLQAMLQRAKGDSTLMKKCIVSNLWWITLLLGLIMLIAHALSLNAVKVDNTSIILLLVIALSPFISAVTKIKFGDFEAEIDPKEVQKIKDQVSAQVTDSDKTRPTPEIENTVNAIQGLVDSDPILALAKLRIELEKVLNKLYRMTHTGNQQRRPMSAGQLAYSLSAAEILPKDIAQSIQQVISICNRAIHGEEIRHQDARSVAEVGMSLLSELAFYVNDLVLKPIESTEIDQTVVNEFMNARYQVTTIVPLVDQPRKEVRVVDQEGLDELLEGYHEYAEFIVDVTKIDSVAAA